MTLKQMFNWRNRVWTCRLH